jgi:tetratricopeptide (TPR) repeat protein
MSDDVRKVAPCVLAIFKASKLVPFIKQEPLPKPPYRKRRWQIPPLPNAVVRGFPGLSIVEEINDSSVAILLWQRFNDVQEWLRTPDVRKPGLFAFPAEYDGFLRRAADLGEMRNSLLALRQILEAGKSGHAREVARLCEQIGAWASREGFAETGAMYYLLAAHAAPTDQVLNFAAGRAERICARYHRAEQWFQRSIGLSRRAGDDETYTSAYLGWGLLEEQRGDHAAALARYTRALRAAQRGKLRPLAAAAHHNMIPLAAQARDFNAGQAHIVAAYKLYGKDATIIRLAADAAAFWAWFGYFQLARSVYAAAVERIEQLPDRVQVLANIGRAAAAVRDASEYLRIQIYITELASAGRHFPARVWVDLAEGARSLGQIRTALDLAGRALEEAEARGEQATLAAAREVLGAVQSATPADHNESAPERLQRFATRLIKRVKDFPVCAET